MSVAIVIPLFNEEIGIPELFARLCEHVPGEFHVVCVNDGSSDGTADLALRHPLRTGVSRSIVSLSRNFGHQNAVMAGLAHVPDESTEIVVMDGDLQDRPEDVVLVLDALRREVDCAYAVRESCADSLVLTSLSKFFYRLQGAVASFSIPPNAGTFCAFNKKFLNHLLQFGEHEVYFPGLRAFIGLRQVPVLVTRSSRIYGTSRVGVVGLLNLSLLGLFCFSAVPTRLVFLSGLVITALCFFAGAVSFLLRVLGIVNVMGWATIVIAIMALSGIQITFIGILGEYIGRIFHEAKGRPRWIVAETVTRTGAESE